MSKMDNHRPMPPEPALVEDIPAPEIFVSGYQSNLAENGVAKLTFFSMGHDVVRNRPVRRVVLRMTATIPAMFGIHQAIGQFLEQVANAEREAAMDHARAGLPVSEGEAP